MFLFNKRRTYPIGIDLGEDTLKMVQFADNSKGISLIAGGSENRPVDIVPGSSTWQRWAIEAIKKATSNGRFSGKNVTAAIPASEMFVDNIKMPKVGDEKPEEAIFSKIKQKLTFDFALAMIKYIPTEEDNIIVIATEREKIDRHLAIYERANLQIESIGIWPVALANSYARFFGRRKTDLQAIVMLIDIKSNSTNVVISRYKNPLFARSIPVGARQLGINEMISRLVMELVACKKHFGQMYRNIEIERLIFLSGRVVEKETYTALAKQLEMPAQMGDCLTAVEAANIYELGIDRRASQFSWAIAFGLALP
jgi:Tfp pilus assembly PilM family ATPase